MASEPWRRQAFVVGDPGGHSHRFSASVGDPLGPHREVKLAFLDLVLE